MPEPTTTPGETAYAAYCLTRYGMPVDDAALTYARSLPAERTAWEAAAEAVRAHRMTDDTCCPLCGTHDLASTPPGLTADGEVHRDMTCEDCGATWVLVYTFAAARYVQRQEDPDHA